MKEKTKKNKYALAIFLVAVFAVTFVLSALTPLTADDYNYAFNWAYGDELVRIDNYQLVWDSMASHRYFSHGRVLAHGLVSVFLMWPRWIFFAANSLLLTLFASALVRFFRRNMAVNPLRASACVLALYWICMPAFGQVFLWLDGACNYFWAATFAFILLEAVFSLEQGKAGTLRMILLLLLSFAVGSWSEHISFAALMIQFLYLISERVQRKKLPVREGLIFLSGCGGYLFLMLAPSMLPSILKNRALEAAEDHARTFSSLFAAHGWLILAGVVILSVLIVLVIRQPDHHGRLLLLTRLAFIFCLAGGLFFAVREIAEGGLYALVSSTAVGFLSLMCVFFAGLHIALEQRLSGDALRIPLILFFGGLSALIPFSVAMYVPARGFCAPVVFAGIAAVLLWEKTEIHWRKKAVQGLCAVFVLLFLIGCTDIFTVHHAELVRQEAIREALAGNGVLVASPYPEKTKYCAQYGLQDLSEEEDWPKDMIKEFYGLKEIIVISED